MAKLINNKVDTFQADGSSSGDEYESGLIQIPHYLGRMMVEVSDAAARGEAAAPAVQMIKFLREYHLDNTGKHLGLKDAKDIMDHYFNIGRQPRHSRPAPYA